MKYRQLIVSTALMSLLLTVALGFSSGPLPRLTGGFQEDSCNSCHNSFAVNEGRTVGGLFHIAGVPSHYQEGESYPITVIIGQPGQSRWGFQLSVRSTGTGAQAGQLMVKNDLTQLVEESGVQYIEHNLAGSRAGTRDGPVEFHFDWIAPSSSAGPVFFNASGNAADNGGDPSGDYIYTASAFTRVSGEEEMILTSEQPQSRPRLRMNTTSRFVHIPSPVDLKKGDTETHIEHRFLQPIVEAGPGGAFGIDFGANINLGLNHALTDELSVGVSRARFSQITTFNGTYELHQDPESFWQMSLLAGIEGEDNFHNHYSTFLQLPTSMDYKRLRTHLVPTMIFNSRKDGDLERFGSIGVNPQDNHTFSMGMGLDLALHPRVSLIGEYVPRLAGFGGFANERSALSWGVKLRTAGHVFTVMVSNSREFTPARYGVNAGTTDFALGFDLYRKRWR